jgi:hypothetical protein
MIRSLRELTAACAVQVQDPLNPLRWRQSVDCALHAFGSNDGAEEALLLSEVWMLSEAQMRRVERYFPLSLSILRVDDRRIVRGIIFVMRNGLRWHDAPAAYGAHKTIYNRWSRWSRLSVFS